MHQGMLSLRDWNCLGSKLPGLRSTSGYQMSSTLGLFTFIEAY